MALWGTTDADTSVPTFAKDTIPDAANNTSIYGNTTVSNTVPYAVVGVFGVDKAESVKARTDGKGSVSPGWVLRTATTAGVNSFVVSAGGNNYVNGEIVTVSNGQINAIGSIVTNTGGVALTLTVNPGAQSGYNNTDVISFTSATSVTPGTMTPTTNATGGVTSLVVVSGGTGFGNVQALVIGSGGSGTGLSANVATSTKRGVITSVTVLDGGAGWIANTHGEVAITTVSGVGATVAVKDLKAARVRHETLVAMKVAPTNDGSDDTQFPDA